LETDDKVIKQIMDWIKNPKHFLVFHGSAGIGKTYFCAALVEWIVETFETFRYYKIEDLHSRLRQSFDGNTDYHKVLEYAIDDDIIIIDDIGSDKISEWKEEVFFSIVDERYNTMKPTIFTSNLSRDEFEKTYHKRIISRLFAKENTVIEILDDSKDRRLN